MTIMNPNDALTNIAARHGEADNSRNFGLASFIGVAILTGFAVYDAIRGHADVSAIEAGIAVLGIGHAAFRFNVASGADQSAAAIEGALAQYQFMHADAETHEATE